MFEVELDRLQEYSDQLQTNMETTMESYNSQFNSLCGMIKSNNDELVTLRQEGALAESNFFKISI